jgi:hypothetical protein
MPVLKPVFSFGPSGREVYPDSLSETKAYRGDLTGQPVNQSLTIYFVGDFLFVARFLLGFGGFLQQSKKNLIGKGGNHHLYNHSTSTEEFKFYFVFQIMSSNLKGVDLKVNYFKITFITRSCNQIVVAF